MKAALWVTLWYGIAAVIAILTLSGCRVGDDKFRHHVYGEKVSVSTPRFFTKACDGVGIITREDFPKYAVLVDCTDIKDNSTKGWLFWCTHPIELEVLECY